MAPLLPPKPPIQHPYVLWTKKKKKVGLYCTRKLLSLCALMLAFDCNPDVEVLRTDLSGSFWVSTTGEDSWSPLERGWQESCLWEEPQYSSLPR